jgi:hypothetical protein
VTAKRPTLALPQTGSRTVMVTAKRSTNRLLCHRTASRAGEAISKVLPTGDASGAHLFCKCVASKEVICTRLRQSCGVLLSVKYALAEFMTKMAVFTAG